MGVLGEFWEKIRACARGVGSEGMEGCHLAGKTLAVDMSAWLVEANMSVALCAVHANPHLFLTHTRVLFLRRLGCRCVAVFEGQRDQRKRWRGDVQPRGSLEQWGKETEQLLRALGVPCFVADAASGCVLAE